MLTRNLINILIRFYRYQMSRKIYCYVPRNFAEWGDFCFFHEGNCR